MSITVLSRITMHADDLALLDKMANAAGKSRDEFISDWIRQLVTIEQHVHRDRVGVGG